MNTMILIGFMGAGKTTIGDQLANTLKVPFDDSDSLIVKQTGQAIPEYFKKHPVSDFRAQEAQVLETYLMHPKGIFATGGGVVDSPKSLALLRETTVPIIYLQASFGTIAERLKDDIQRPMLQQHSFLEVADLYQQRSQQYEKLANKIVCVDGMSPKEIVEQLL